jgi:hypothetical protein
MPRKTGHVPAYRLHKPSGQARVIISHEHIYLGKYGSAESREKYARLITEKNSDGGSPPAPNTGGASLSQFSVNDLILAYWRFAKTHYVKDGKPTDTLPGIRAALRYLRNLFGGAPVIEFGPKSLKILRQHMTEVELSRGVVNRR